MSISVADQLDLFDIGVKKGIREQASTTFIDNMRLPVHRWFRYSAGFSAEWVKETIKQYAKHDSRILDPFAGSGTTLVAANEMLFPSIGFEKQYFVHRIANIKLHYTLNIDHARRLYNEVIHSSILRNFNFDEQSDLLKKCYTPEMLNILISMRNTYIKIADNTFESEILWLAITAILRSTSHAGTAQWQYIQPNKKKKNVIDPRTAISQKFNEILRDIQLFNEKNITAQAAILNHDARESLQNYEESFDILITSPPYPNNYDYADATRFEMIFWDEIGRWGDLQTKVRNGLIRSCSQHSAAEKLNLDTILNNPLLIPIFDELTAVCKTLEQVRLEHGGKKTYHTMIAAYYLDLAKVFITLRKLMRENSVVCFVIGDSAPYGVYAPADLWLGKLAIAAGFTSWSFEKTRDRNTKWKNRKHRVPLKEGRLWIRG
ncbi:MAG: site-specific DNA-methyltransferase [Treponema sp.]|nr:site-specific DNA-methyltransferase [Treponema sp.]